MLVVVETVPSNVDVAELGKYSACGTLLVLCEVLRQWDYVLRRHLVWVRLSPISLSDPKMFACLSLFVKH